MANLSIEDVSLGMGEEAVQPSPSIGDISKVIKGETQRLKDVDESTFENKSVAFVEAAKNVNFVVEGFRWADKKVMDSAFDKDENFLVDDESALAHISKNQLPMESFGDVVNAKSQGHLDMLTQRYRENMIRDNNIQHSLGETGQISAGVTGAVIDVDMVGGFAVGAFTKGSTIAKIITIEGGLEGGLVIARNQIKDDYTAGDAAFDATIGVVAVTAGATAPRFFKRKEGVDKANDAPVQTEEATSATRQQVDELSESFRERDLPETEAPVATQPTTDAVDIAKPDVPKAPKLTTKQRQEQADAFVASNVVKYNIPKAAHGTRTVTDTIITHRTAGHGFHPNDTRLTEKGLGAHYTIDKKGVIHQINDDGDKMWHAGNMNGRSVGIEVTGKFDPKTQTWEKMTPAQKKSLDALGRSLSKKYGISIKNIKAHSEVAAKSANEGVEAKLYLQSVLNETPKKTQKRLAKLEKNIENAPNPKRRAAATRDYDDAGIEVGRRQNQADDVTEANGRDTQQRPTRTKTHTENRKNFFENDIYDETNIALKNVDTLDAQIAKAQKAGDEALEIKLTKQLDSQMDDLYDISFNSSTNRLMRTVDEMAGDVDGMRFEVEEMRKLDPDGFDDAMEEVRMTDPETYATIEDMITKPQTKETAEEFTKDMVKKGKMSKKMAVATATLLGGSALHAGEGSENNGAAITAAFLAIVASAVFGPQLLRSLKNKGFNRAMSQANQGWKDALKKGETYTSPNSTKLRRVGATIMANAHTRFTSTVAPFIKAGEKTEALISNLLYSAKTGGGAEIDKASWVHSTMARYDDMEAGAFKLWKDENGVSGFNSYLDEGFTKETFRKNVSDAVELIADDPVAFKKLPKSIQDAATQYDALKKELYDRASEYEVHGFVDRVDGDGKTIKGVTHEDGKLPRYWNSSRMNNLLTTADDPDALALALEDSLTTAFDKSMHDTVAANRVAKRFVEDWATGRNLGADGRPRSGDDMFDSIEHLLDDGVDAADLGDALATRADRIARAKERLKLNVQDIEPVKATVNGDEIIIGKDVIIERDAKVILDRTANSLAGHSALAKNGYKSVKALDDSILEATTGVKGGDTLRNELHQVKDLVLGIPVPSNNKFIHNISMMMKDLTIVAKLPLVTFSMPPEFIAALTTSTLSRGVRSFTRALTKEYPKDSNMIQIMEMSGLGTSFKRLDFTGFRGYGDVGNDLDDIGVQSKMRDGTMKLRDASLIINGLAYFSDGLQRMGMELHTEKIAAFINKGDVSASGIPKHRQAEFGLDDDFIEMFKDTFELDGKTVKAFDASKWGIKKRDRFATVLRNMNQQVSPETTIGETGLYTRTTDLGRSISGLITYPMGQFNQYGLNDLRHLDRGSVVHSMGAFMGAYIGLSLRYSAQGKDTSEEDKVLFALMNMPQIGALSALRSMLDPAAMSTARDAYNLLAPSGLETGR